MFVTAALHAKLSASAGWNNAVGVCVSQSEFFQELLALAGLDQHFQAEY